VCLTRPTRPSVEEPGWCRAGDATSPVLHLQVWIAIMLLAYVVATVSGYIDSAVLSYSSL